jgi:UDP-N-acetylmuramyl pentapeptide phosphotransferase/UDP-N-acetylglucosamine-1-phosphate transferase
VLSPVAAELVAPGDRWLLAFTIATVLVLVGGIVLRREARRRGSRGDADRRHEVRGLRRRAGALLGLGALVGWLVAPGAGHGAFVAAAGAVALAIVGAVAERWKDFSRQIYVVVLVAAVVAVIGGTRFAPTGVGPLDVIGGVAFVFAVVVAFDGLGNADGLVPGLGLVSATGVLALAAFPGRLGPANVVAGLAGACLAFLAFNLRPASLFAGRGGRLAVGYALAVTALSVRPAVGAPASLAVPLMVVAIPLFDLTFVAVDRLRRRRPLLVGRRDHLLNRFLARDATQTEAVLLVVAVQALFVVFAVFAGRGLVSMWVVAPLAVLVLAGLGGAALQGKLERLEPVGLSARATGVLTLVCVLIALAIVPVALTVPDVADTMQDGRRAAQRGLAAARNGDTANAAFAFQLAAESFDDAAHRMNAAVLQPARLIPALAPNVRAARTLAQVGRDLSRAGAQVSATVVPESLTVFNGRVDLAEVQRVTPALDRAADALEESLVRVRDVADDPYLISPVRKAARQVRAQLVQSAGEARRTADAARLAQKILGGDGTRRYLLVVQNNAEARATGGFIGSYGVLTAQDGKVSVGKLLRTGSWNAAIAQAAGVKLNAPAAYVRRYGQFQPERVLQNVNLSPDFPTVADVLMSLTDEAGLGKVDGVMAVDPKGLAALLQLTGPVNVPGWPTPITADNVVDVTLRDAYAEFARTPERADFLGDVAQVVVDQATSGELGKPAQVARVLGAAAHEGHISLAYARADEQRLARQLATHGAAPHSGQRDVFEVTTSNVSANKLDYYLRRVFDYRITLDPDAPAGEPNASAEVNVNLQNTAPTTGLPQVVAGPFEGQPGRFRAGELLSYVSVYTPLDLEKASVGGQPVVATQSDELGGHVISTYVDLDAETGKTLRLELAGRVPVQRGRWYELDLGHQPSLEPDRARVTLDVPDGWKIDRVSGGVAKPVATQATRSIQLDRPTRIRIHVVRDGTNLWERLKAGD